MEDIRRTTMTSKTINLTGAELAVAYAVNNYPYVWLRNDSATVIYASSGGNITAGSDGVMSIPAGQSACVYCTSDIVYLLGTGSVMLVASNTPECPFKVSILTGGSSSVDDVARAAIGAHAGNADVHVTAAQKSAWDAKAELSDIPNKLPADGGNAATLGGKSASEFLQGVGGLTSGSLLEYALTLSASGWLVAGPNVTDTPNPGKTFFVEVRNYNGYLELVACQTGANTMSVNNYNKEVWFGWHNVSDNGNATSVGAYTEAKLAALEARVAALEGGT